MLNERKKVFAAYLPEGPIVREKLSKKEAIEFSMKHILGGKILFNDSDRDELIVILRNEKGEDFEALFKRSESGFYMARKEGSPDFALFQSEEMALHYLETLRKEAM